MKKHIIAWICLMILGICQVFLVMPEYVSAETPGETLIVRVQYAGEREEKIREKARFSTGQLEAMGAAEYRYSNVTDVGTVLSMIAYGPKVTAIIEKSGIDLGSIKYIHFRTIDGTGEHQRYSRSHTVSRHLTANRYFYPELQKNYERNDDETLTPLPGSLDHKKTVPAILAIKSYSTKQPSRVPESSDMTTDKSYRFCLGQTPLQEGVKTRNGYDGGDVSSVESAQSIFGMDITLYGSPVDGLKLNLDDTNLKVGSKKKISAVIEGDELFKDDWGFTAEDLTWKSNDTSIAVVDDNGIITIKKEGTVTITATAPNGMSASVTINASGDGETQEAGAAANKKDKKEKKEKKEKTQGIVVKEVKIGGMLDDSAGSDDPYRQQMAQDAQALDRAEESDPQVVLFSAFTSVIVFGFGIVFRIMRFFEEV